MRDSFVLFREHFDMILELSDEQAGQLLKTIFQYQSGETVEITDQAVKIAFVIIRKQMDKCSEKYDQVSEARREAGKLGGRPKKQSEAKKANAFLEKQSDAKKPDNDNDNDLKEITPKGVTKKKFTPPTKEQVQEYVNEQKYNVDVEKFIDFYTSKGWMVGKNPMKDWKAAVRNWSRSQRQELTAKDTKPVSRFGFQQRQYDYDDLERRLTAAQWGGL